MGPVTRDMLATVPYGLAAARLTPGQQIRLLARGLRRHPRPPNPSARSLRYALGLRSGAATIRGPGIPSRY
ncbi:hypothetical protein [Streptomyces sp. ITFR-6]|uniref:hypothetical protein n=1 Tax=Streptomyces sp. ITFR-6 TaxID=3075197 RepID=UPI00288985DD|nr:hypothetical protein [Streptomyces sp. ITFR-6]WNI34441.1 hypothetical protein RLT59_38145 [Streptomyces sp. ITFR-6]